MDDQQQALIKLDGKLGRMMDGIEGIKEKQEEMAEDISKIKGVVYDPDQGIYARIRELESWKEVQSRIMWIVLTSIFGFAVLAIWEHVVATG